MKITDNSTLRKIISLCYLPWVVFKEKILGKGGVRILMFHSVAATHVSGFDNQGVVDINPNYFKRLIRYLVQRYRFISLEELTEMIEHKIKLPSRTLVLTFDDGYANNYTEALPILKEYQLRATIFMPSGFVGKPNYLDTEMINKLVAEDLDIGGHTVNHPVLSRIDQKTAEVEITEGKTELEKVLGKPVNLFAYPKGKLTDYSDKVVQMVEKAGFKAACTTVRGTNTWHTPLFELRRIGIDGSDSFFNFWLKLHGGYDWTGSLSRLKHRLK